MERERGREQGPSTHVEGQQQLKCVEQAAGPGSVHRRLVFVRAAAQEHVSY